MESLLSALGRIFLFTAFLPGVAGLAAASVMFPSAGVLSLTWYHQAAVAFAIGVAANALGHFSEWVLLDLLSSVGLPGADPQGRHLVGLQLAGIQVDSRIFTFLDYSDSLRAWYWNTAVILTVISFASCAVLLCDIQSVRPFLAEVPPPALVIKAMDVVAEAPMRLFATATSLAVSFLLGPLSLWIYWQNESYVAHLKREPSNGEKTPAGQSSL